MRGAAVIPFLFLIAAGSARAEDCPVELKATDGYRELSAILRCQERRIKALEGNGDTRKVQSPAAAVQANEVWEPGKCLPFAKEQPFKATITIERQRGHKGLQLCWSDGEVFANVYGFGDSSVEIRDSAGRFVTSPGAFRSCPFNVVCKVEAPGAVIQIRPTALAPVDGTPRARFSIESRPKQ
jgi:hypothetical protein